VEMHKLKQNFIFVLNFNAIDNIIADIC